MLPRLRMRALLSGLFLLFCSSLPLLAQSTPLPLFDTDHTPRPSNTSRPVPDHAAFFRLNRVWFDSVSSAWPRSGVVREFPFPDGSHHTLRLERFDVLSSAGTMFEGRLEGDRALIPDKQLFFRGTVEGVEESFVYLSIFPGFVFGFIELPSPGSELPQRIMIAPDNLDNAVPTMIAFDEGDAPSAGTPPLCATEDPLALFSQRTSELESLRREVEGKGVRRNLQSEPHLVAQIAVECDDDFFKVHSSNLSRSANYALALMGAASAVYQRDIGIELQVPFLRIWTTGSNPFPGPKDGDLLGQLREHWQSKMQGVQRTSAVLMTSYRGGVAWVGTMCGSYGYAMVGPGGNFNFPATAYVWDIDVTSHELGHNFGSPHTHSCFWAPAVDSCYASEGGCFPATNPHPGTIMSYCHLSVGTVLKFHPRVATYIRAAAERYSCVTPPPVPATHDAATIAIATPATGGLIGQGVSFTPSALVRNLGLTSQSNLSVTCSIINPEEVEVYSSIRTVASLAPGATAQVVFQTTGLIDTGVCQVVVTVTATEDNVPVNNTITRPFAVVPNAPGGSLQLISPNGGEVYAADSVVAVEWRGTGVGEVTLDLSIDSGLSWQTVRWSARGDSGKYMWTVPPLPTNRALVRVAGISDARLVDRSNATFIITLDSDAAATEFIEPHFNDTMTGAFVPRVEVRNNGSRALTDLPVRLTLSWRPGDLIVYDTIVTVPLLAAAEVQIVDFPRTPSLPEGNVVMIARTYLDGDRNPSNDSISRTAELVGGISPPSSIASDGLDSAAWIRWAASTTSGITGYRVYRGTSPETMTAIATVRPTVHVFVDDPLANDQIYYYAVTTLKDTLESMLSPTAVADPTWQIAGLQLAPPLLLHPRNGMADVPLPLDLVWGTVTGATLYQVQVAADPACTDVISNEVVFEPHILNPGITRYGESFYWRVRAFNKSWTGPWSAASLFWTGESCAGNAVVFNGESSGLLDTGFVWAGGPVTVEFWTYVKSGDLKSASLFGIGADDDIAQRFQAHVPWSDGTLYWDYGDVNNNGRITTDFTPYLDRWVHVALVSNGSNYKAIYIDGKLIRSATSASSPQTLNSLRLGSAANNRYPSTASLDEFRIWNRVRTAEEIERDMNRSINDVPDLVARYSFNEGSGTATAGLAGRSIALLPNTTWTVSGASIGCISQPDLAAPTPGLPAQGTSVPSGAVSLFTWGRLNEADAYWLQIASDSDFTSPVASIDNIASTWYAYGALDAGQTYYWRVRGVGLNGPGAWSSMRSFATAEACADRSLVLNGSGNLVDIPSFVWGSRAATVELWMRVDSADVRNSWLFYTGPADSSARFSSHAPWSDKKLVFDYGTYANKGRLQVDYAPYLGKWTHVALVSNGKDFKGIYLNGELIDSAASASRLRGPRQGLVIGGSRNGTSTFKSRITEFRVWNVARTQGAIREEMYHRLDGVRSGLVGYWPLDGRVVDSIVVDASGFGHDALLRNGPAWDTATPFPGPLPVTVTGLGSVEHDTAGVVYAAGSGASSYHWIVVGGAIVSGQSTSSITVDWGGGPEGIVALVAAPGSCDLLSVLPVAITGATGEVARGAERSALLAVHPNPTGGSFEIPVSLIRSTRLSVTVHDIRGAEVAVVAEGTFGVGTTSFHFDGSALPPGLYAVKLTTPDGSFTRLVTVVR